MQVVRFPSDARPPRWHQPVVALGNFDGLHRGHLKIVDRVRRRAAERAGTAVVMTFDPHPPRVVRPDKAPALIMTIEQKLEAFDRAGMQGVAIVEFTREMSLWAPELFVEKVIVEWLRASEVWVGANFLFGHERAGNFSLLRMLGEQHDFRAEKIDAVRYKDFVVSSTRSNEKLPVRSWPNRKFAPTQTSATRSQSTSTRCTNASGSQRDNSGVNRTTAAPITPAAAIASSFCAIVISSGGALSGRTTRGGCGSKVMTTAMAPRSLATRRTLSRILR